MKYEVRMSTVFKKDLKLAKKRNMNMTEINFVIKELANGNQLDKKYKDHALVGNWAGYRECHIEPDWLLIYRIDGSALLLYLMRTGTHSDILDN